MHRFDETWCQNDFIKHRNIVMITTRNDKCFVLKTFSMIIMTSEWYHNNDNNITCSHWCWHQKICIFCCAFENHFTESNGREMGFNDHYIHDDVVAFITFPCRHFLLTQQWLLLAVIKWKVIVHCFSSTNTLSLLMLTQNHLTFFISHTQRETHTQTYRF